MPVEPDYSRAALARFIEFVVAKGLVNPSTAQGWRVATSKVLEELAAEELADVRRIDTEATFRAFLHRHPGRLSPASVGEYRRRVGRAIEEFVRWVDDPGSYGAPGSAGSRGAEGTGSRRRKGPGSSQPALGPAEPPVGPALATASRWSTRCGRASWPRSWSRPTSRWMRPAGWAPSC